MSSLTIFDRGPSPYFHGREEILQTFSDYLTLFRKEKRGTIFLIQGAPGAGKTALLDVLFSLAKEDLWDVAEIKVKDLHNPVSMAQSLGESYVIDNSTKLVLAFMDWVGDTPEM